MGRTPFINRYLLDKIRAIAQTNATRDQDQAAQKILGLVQDLIGSPAWVGLYVAAGREFHLALARGDDACEFPTDFTPERQLSASASCPSYRTPRKGRLGEIRLPIAAGDRTAGVLRIQTVLSSARTAVLDGPTQRLLEEIAQEIAPLLPGLLPDRLLHPPTTTTPDAKLLQSRLA